VNNYYRTFPWLGYYLKSIRASSDKKIFEPALITAVCLTVFLLYIVYIAMARMTNAMLFGSGAPFCEGLEDNFLLLMASMELFSSFFLRTRESLTYIPRLALLSSLSFLSYLQLCPLPLHELALSLLNSLYMLFALSALLLLELPSLSQHLHDFSRATEMRPRALYQPFFSLTWYHDLPPLWTMFVPFFDRDCFCADELTLVDEERARMAEYLRR